MNLRRRKSKQQQAADLLADYLKLKAVSKTAKGAKKTAKGTAVYKVAKDQPSLVKRIPLIVLGAGAAVFAAVKLIGGGGDDSAPAGA